MRRTFILLLAAMPTACVVKTEPAIGEQGPPGLDGDDGKAGVDGTSGKDGQDGAPGMSGEDGQDGAPGASPYTYVDPDAMTDIYYTNGKVGIGTATPSESLDVNGGLHASGPITTNSHVTHTTWTNLAVPEGPWEEGYWKLVTPIAHNEENMFIISITMYRYGLGGRVLTAQCGGYAWGGDGDPSAGMLVYTNCRADGSWDPIGIGVENDKVVIAVGSKGHGPWYVDKAMFEYVGQVPHKAEDFHWDWVHDALLPYANHNNVLIDDATGAVGIGTAPVATLDVNGTARLKKYSGEPFACDAAHDGTMALTTKHRMCVCNGTSWVQVLDGLLCSWNTDPLIEATYATSAVFRGQSSAPVDGDLKALVPGSMNGYAAAKSICNNQLNSASAHMCTAEEVARSAAVGIPVPNGWYVAATYSYYEPLDRQVTDCAGFTTNNVAQMGHGWADGPNIYSCSLVLPVLCCDR